MLTLVLGAVDLDSEFTGPWVPLALIALAVAVGAVVVPLLGVTLSGAWRLARASRRRRRRRDAAVNAEARARAMMSELCPHGWRAQITLFGGDDADDHRPLTRDGRRALGGAGLDGVERPSGRPAVMRRVWATTVAEALEAMVADRRTDETLERIERGAVADGALWPDL